MDIIKKLISVLEERKKSDPEKSYVASLYKKGSDTILKKVAEECAEFIMSVKDRDSSKSYMRLAI